MLFSTTQHKECMASGGMSLCPTHSDGSPITTTDANSHVGFTLWEPSDIRFTMRNIKMQVRTDSEPGKIKLRVRQLHDFRLGFVCLGGVNLETHVTADERMIEQLEDEATWDAYQGRHWLRGLPLLAATEYDEDLKQTLTRVVEARAEDCSDSILLDVEHDGIAFAHIGYVLNEATGYGASLRLQSKEAEPFWFGADDGSNVLYLGMLRINTKTGNRDKVIDFVTPREMLESRNTRSMSGNLSAVLNPETAALIEKIFGNPA
jgi:hypothetical protein